MATNISKGSKGKSFTEVNAGKIGTCSVDLKIFLVGACDNQVRAIQRLFYALGYTDRGGKPLKADGELGENIAYAITRFQKDKEIEDINFGTVAGMTRKLLLNSL